MSVVGPTLLIQPCMVSPSTIQVTEEVLSNDSGASGNMQNMNGANTDVLKITPSIVIG